MIRPRLVRLRGWPPALAALRGCSLALPALVGGLLLSLPALAAPPVRPDGLGDVRDVRHWSYPGWTRVVVELTRPVTAEVRRLPAAEGRPERLYLDLEGIWIGRRYAEPIPVRDGLLHALRLGQNTLERTRLVIDLSRYERHRLLLLRSPDRVVVDVHGPQPPHEGDAQRRLSSELRPIQTVVLDPGHGGRDPGAVGVGGLREKDVTLALARELSSCLEDRDFRVILTREGDEALDLEERTARAEAARGDVFVSLHANAARRHAASGIETYYLDASHERHTLRLAALENGTTPGDLDELQRTLATLRVSEHSLHSHSLARSVHGALLEGLRRRYHDVPDLGVKSGPFYVLFLSSMPGILVETGFLTNRAEARRVRTRAWRELVAGRICEGLVRWRAQRGLLVAGPGS